MKNTLLKTSLATVVALTSGYGVLSGAYAGKPDDSVTIHTVDGDRKIETGDFKNAKSLLESYGEDYKNYQDDKGNVVDSTTLLDSTKSLVKTTGKTTSQEEDVPFETEIKEDPTMLSGTEKVETEGVVGKILKTTTVKATASGENQEKETITVMSKPTNKVIVKGTASPRRAPVVHASPRYSVTDVDTRNKAVEIASKYVGKNYVWGAVGPNAFDCSGLVMKVYSELGYKIPRTAYAQGLSGKQISWSEIQPGDLIYNSGHIIIYAGNGKVIHASSPSRGVVIDPVEWYEDGSYSVARL